MRQTLQLDWDFLEIEKEEEWVEMTAIPVAEDADRSHGRGDKRAWMSMMALTVVAVAIVGFRLWLIAEEGAAAIERDLGALTQTETISMRKFSAHDLPATTVESVRLNASGAMVCVVVTETLASGESVSRSETRFYKPVGNQWRRTAPISSFWGRAAEMETATLHFDFHALDRPYVEAIAEPLAAYHQALRGLLGLPAPTQPMTVTIAPDSVPIRMSGPDGAIVLPSPRLYSAPSEPVRVAIFMDATRAILTVRTFNEAISYYHVTPNWQPHVDALQGWVLLRGGNLPEYLASQTGSEKASCCRCSPYAFNAMLNGNDADYYDSPGYAEYGSGALTAAVHALIDCLAHSHRIDAVPALLAGFRHHESWSTLAPDVFGVSAKDLARLWACNREATGSPLTSP